MRWYVGEQGKGWKMRICKVSWLYKVFHSPIEILSHDYDMAIPHCATHQQWWLQHPPSPSFLTSLPPPLWPWQWQTQWPQYPATPPVGPHSNCVTHHAAQMTFIIVWATGKFSSPLLHSLFYGLTNCFYLSFRLTTTLQPQSGMPYAQPPTPPFPTTVGPCKWGGKWGGDWTITLCRGDVGRPVQQGSHKVCTPALYTHHLVAIRLTYTVSKVLRTFCYAQSAASTGYGPWGLDDND